jgi:hypothetical protein
MTHGEVPVKTLLAAAGFGALATMAVLVTSAPSAQSAQIAVVGSRPTVEHSVTKAQIPVATPPVKAQPAPTEEPG